MKRHMTLRGVAIASAILAATLGIWTLATDLEAADGRKCPRGIKPCSANQVGQSCDPNNPNLICSAQANGGFCCLAYAP